MKVRIRSFAYFRDILGDNLDVDLVDGSTVKDLIDDLVSSHRGFSTAVFDEDGNLREEVILMKNRKVIQPPEGLASPLADGDEVALLPPVAGG